jgi:DNA-binding transcriptional LysR family regulator
VDLDQFKALVLVSRKGTLNRAARDLGLTASAVSLRLKRLETELNLKLFDHRPNKLLLSENARLLAEHAARALEDLDRAISLVRGKDTQAQRVSIALGSDTAFLLGGPIANFVENTPRIKLSIVTRSSSEILSSVLEDRIDFGIGRFSKLPRELRAIDLHLPHRLAAIARKAANDWGPKPLSIESLASHPLIVLPQHSATRQRIEERFAERSLDMKVAIEVGGCFAIKEFVRLGLGIGLVHDICISKTEHAQFATKDLNHVFGQWETMLIYKKAHPLSEIHRDLIDKIFAAVKSWKKSRVCSSN